MGENAWMQPAEALSAASGLRREAGAGPTILICRPNTRLGNTLLITPLVEEIETALPNARIDILSACPAAQEIFQAFPGVYRVHQLPFRGVRHPLRFLLTLLRVRRVHYDIIIDPCPNSWTARFLTRRLAGRLKVGFTIPRRRQGVDVSVPFTGAPRHMGDYPVYLLRRALLDQAPEDSRAIDARLNLRLSDAERALGREQLARLVADRTGPVVAVALHATGAKRYPVSWWRTMLAELARRAPAVRLVEIRPPSGVAALPELPGYSSPRTRHVAALIAAADCFVCADSGLMHLGAATDTITVGLFKVTLPELYAPRRGKSCAVTASDEQPAMVAERIALLLA